MPMKEQDGRIPSWLEKLTPGATKARKLKQRSPKEIEKMDKDTGKRKRDS